MAGEQSRLAGQREQGFLFMAHLQNTHLTPTFIPLLLAIVVSFYTESVACVAMQICCQKYYGLLSVMS